jgi:hypothetical protein
VHRAGGCHGLEQSGTIEIRHRLIQAKRAHTEVRPVSV